MSSSEQIKLTLPVNAAYVSAARLTASSVANRLNFDIEEIEDIKVAVSEACTYIIKNPCFSSNDNFKIEFNMSKDNIKINLSVESDKKVDIDDDEMSLRVIKAIMNSTDINYDGRFFNMTIEKKHIQVSFN